MVVYKKYQLIEKEEIANYIFPKGEVLKDRVKKELRSININKALKLGNKFKNKVHIFFEDNFSLKRVETTIWGVTEKYIILKQNVLIPIERVYSINL